MSQAPPTIASLVKIRDNLLKKIRVEVDAAGIHTTALEYDLTTSEFVTKLPHIAKEYLVRWKDACREIAVIKSKREEIQTRLKKPALKSMDAKQPKRVKSDKDLEEIEDPEPVKNVVPVAQPIQVEILQEGALEPMEEEEEYVELGDAGEEEYEEEEPARAETMTVERKIRGIDEDEVCFFIGDWFKSKLNPVLDMLRRDAPIKFTPAHFPIEFFDMNGVEQRIPWILTGYDEDTFGMYVFLYYACLFYNRVPEKATLVALQDFVKATSGVNYKHVIQTWYGKETDPSAMLTKLDGLKDIIFTIVSLSKFHPLFGITQRASNLLEDLKNKIITESETLRNLIISSQQQQAPQQNPELQVQVIHDLVVPKREVVHYTLFSKVRSGGVVPSNAKELSEHHLQPITNKANTDFFKRYRMISPMLRSLTSWYRELARKFVNMLTCRTKQEGDVKASIEDLNKFFVGTFRNYESLTSYKNNAESLINSLNKISDPRDLQSATRLGAFLSSVMFIIPGVANNSWVDMFEVQHFHKWGRACKEGFSFVKIMVSADDQASSIPYSGFVSPVISLSMSENGSLCEMNSARYLKWVKRSEEIYSQSRFPTYVSWVEASMSWSVAASALAKLVIDVFDAVTAADGWSCAPIESTKWDENKKAQPVGEQQGVRMNKVNVDIDRM